MKQNGLGRATLGGWSGDILSQDVVLKLRLEESLYSSVPSFIEEKGE